MAGAMAGCRTYPLLKIILIEVFDSNFNSKKQTSSSVFFDQSAKLFSLKHVFDFDHHLESLDPTTHSLVVFETWVGTKSQNKSVEMGLWF